MPFRLLRTLLLAGALLSVAPHALAQEDLVLQRASDWNLHYAEDSCVLRRTFASGDHSAVLEMRQFAPTPDIRFSVVSGDLEPRFRNFRYRIDPDAEAKEAIALFALSAPGGLEGVLFTGSLLPGEDDADEDEAEVEVELDALRERETHATGLGILGVFEQDVFLETGSLGPPMEAMRGCLAELLSHWGIDTAAHESLSRRVTPVNRNRWVGRIMGRYPTSGIVGVEQASVSLRVIVDPRRG